MAKRKIDEIIETSDNFSLSSSKRKRQNYSLEFKIEVIEEAKKSYNTTIARKYNIDEKLVRDWRKNENKIKATQNSSCQKKQD